ncbi:hypothetical protein JCM15519_17380 [Fundidesulfovibrio butyratiphilus]
MNCSSCPHGQACCRKFVVPVTVEEHLSGLYQISLDRRVVHLARRPDGSCVYLTAAGRCAIYDRRPETCREYTCAGDRRVGGE